jgi:hypothetical protein
MRVLRSAARVLAALAFLGAVAVALVALHVPY